MPPSIEPLQVGDYIAVQDNPLRDVYWIHRITRLDDQVVHTNIYGARSPVLHKAKFVELWEKGNQLHTRRPPGGKLWTAELPVSSLPKMVLARNLALKTGATTTGQLTKASVSVLNSLGGQVCHADLSGDIARYL